MMGYYIVPLKDVRWNVKDRASLQVIFAQTAKQCSPKVYKKQEKQRNEGSQKKT